MPWYARLLALGIVGYVLSPPDLIPDPIPILGYLNDVILLPIGVWALLRLIPPQVLTDARERADSTTSTHSGHRLAATIIILLWIALAGVVAYAFLL